MKKDQTQPKQKISRDPFPNSEKIYVQGNLYPNVKVPMRKITLDETVDKFNGKVTKNDPVLVYDTSGPYTDPAEQIDVKQGLKPVRNSWIAAREDVEQKGIKKAR